jgi:7-keto-8-aminopelargonate synthetase-like enzyme
VWANFCATIDKQYVEMLVRRGNTTLKDNSYVAYNAMAKEKSVALSENLEQYEESAARTEARISNTEAQMEAMAINAQPLKIGLLAQEHGANYAHNAMAATPGFYGQGSSYYQYYEDYYDDDDDDITIVTSNTNEENDTLGD